MDEPDIIDQSQLQSQRSSANALQARDSHRSGGDRRLKGQARDRKYTRTSGTGSRESKMEVKASRDGGKRSSRMQRIKIDQVNQSSIAVVDESTNRIEQQLNEELSLDESQQQAPGQRQLISVRSKSVPPELSSATPESTNNYAVSTSFNHGMRPHEISMAQLNQPQAPRVTNLDQQSEQDQNSILFNAYPRDGYPNYAYVQKRYLQNPPAIAHNQSAEDGRGPAIGPNMPLSLPKSPNNRHGDETQHTLVLNHDSASESDADLIARMRPGKNVHGRNEQAFLSRLPEFKNSASRSARRNAATQSKEQQTSRTQKAAREGSRIGKGLDKSYQEKFQQLSL